MGTSTRGRRQFVDTRAMSDAAIRQLTSTDGETEREPPSPPPSNPDQAWEVALLEWWAPTVPLAEWPPVVLWAYGQRALAAADPAERQAVRERLAVLLRGCAASTSPGRDAVAGSGPAARTGSA